MDLMTWRSDEHVAFVSCDHPGCTATVGERLYRAGDDTDRVSAMTYAASAGLRAGWDVPSDKGEGHDRCPEHRQDQRDCTRPDVTAHCSVPR